jgi:hypothetical protein
MSNYSLYDDDFKELIVRTSQDVPFEELSKIHGVPVYLIRYWRYGTLLVGDDLKTATKVAYRLKRPTNHFKWVTKYHAPLDTTSVNAGAVYVTDYEGNRITGDNNLHIETAPNTFSITPSEPYQYDIFYYLHITENLRFRNKKKPKPTTIRFMVVEEHNGKGIRFMKEVVDGYSLVNEVNTGGEMEIEPEQKREEIIVQKPSPISNFFSLLTAPFKKGNSFSPINHAYDWKIVLQWEGACLTDLDLHAYFSSGAFVYFGNKTYEKDKASKAWLDYDYILHAGIFDRVKKPEVLTILGKPDDAANIAVNNFNGGFLKKKITVNVFRASHGRDVLRKSYTITPSMLTGTCTTHAVCIIDLNTQEIEDLV